MSNDYDSKGSASRPSFIEGLKKIRNTNKPPADRVALLAARYASGLDLWTGKPRNESVVPVEALEDEGDTPNPVMMTTPDEFDDEV